MHLLFLIKSLFAEPIFVTGERVNLVRRGTIERTDGYVIAQTDKGVMVEWPHYGTSYMSPSELCVIS